MPYCHKRYYIAKDKCAFVTKICSFMLMVIVFILGVSIRVRAPCRTKRSLSISHRCCAHYIPLAIMVLFVHHDTYAFVLCTYHRFASSLFFLLRSFFERSPGILCLYSVFFTMPCIFWHYFRRREFCCILYNNSLILSILTVSRMCYLLQHHLHPLSFPITQQKNTECPQARTQNRPKIVSPLRCFYHISRMLQPEHHAAQKIHRFSRCMYLFPLLRVNTTRAALTSSQDTISCARDTLRLLYRQK